MNEQTKELIAIGASVSAHCQPCLTYHVGKAKELGVSEEEIQQAIETGHMVEKGAMSAMRKYSANIAGPASFAGSCGCSAESAPLRECCG